MASKIYKKGVFLVIEDTVSGNLKEFNTADVQIVKKNANLDQYEVLVLGVSQLKVNLADIKDEAGSAYSENDWDVFRFNEVGLDNTSSMASNVSYDGTTSGLAATDVQAAIDEIAGDAGTIAYDNLGSGLPGTNVQDAIDDVVVLATQSSASGVVIDFSAPKVFNDAVTEGTGNITDNLTGAKIGVVQKIYHNDGTPPTVPAGWVLIGSGTYTTSSTNIIYAEYCGGTRVEYWIVTI